MSSFGHLLRRSRIEAGLTQEALAAAAGLSTRTISDLERSINHTARRDTTRLLADALKLAGQARAEFEAVAQGARPVGVFAGATRTLPADTRSFTGRQAELEQFDLADRGGVYAIGGMPGVGKTALAVHAAHALAGQFPDRQLYIDLHAHTPGHEPERPEDALDRLLTSIGVDRRYLPGDLDGRAAMWRDRMAGQRALLVLDNAASSSQVAPLLPGTAGCLVLVTSRRHLGDLPGAVTQVPLDTLRPEDAADMFTRLAPRAAGDADGVTEVVALAGFMPLAISLLARVLDRHPCWSLAELAEQTRARLLRLTAEDRSIAAAFDVSYRYLDAGRQRFFRLLGLHPGATTDEYAAAALAGTSLGEAAGHLEALYGEGLLIETGCRRYGMHDLIRRYACGLAAVTPADDGQQALGRLLDYYQFTAALAEQRLARQTRPGTVLPVPARFEVPVLGDAGRALKWVRAERASVLACLDLATCDDQYARVVTLTAGLAELLRRDGPFADAITRHSAAVDAARHLDDRLAEANALTDLGIMQRTTGQHQCATQVLAQAESIYRDLGDRLGEANTLREVATVRWLTGQYHCAAQVLEQALGIHRDLGDRLGEANTLTNLGIVRRVTGDYPGAAKVLRQAMVIYRGLGDQLGEVSTLRELGNVWQLTGDYPGAAQVVEQVLRICRVLDSRLGEANALNNLGAMRRETGDYRGAAKVLRQAVVIYRGLGDRLGEANAHGNLGIVRRVTGNYRGAARVLERALLIYRDLGNRLGETEVLNEQGTLHRVGGDLVRAQLHHRRALDLARAIGSSRDEACALAGLGRCARAADRLALAGCLLRQAYQIFHRIGAVETRDVLAELDTL